MTCRIRAAEPADAPAILSLLHRAAAFHEEPEGTISATEERLAAAFSGPSPLIHALLAEDEAGGALGLATYYFTFSTYKARPTLYVEDLFVEEAARGRRVGTALMERLAQVALSRDCRAMEWETYTKPDNAALPFYRERIGAEIVEMVDGGKAYRLRLPEEGVRRLQTVTWQPQSRVMAAEAITA